MSTTTGAGPDSPTDGTRTHPDPLAFLEPSAFPGSIGRLGHYEILALLGKGGYGTVFKAHDTKLLREVAIKVLDVRHGPNSVAGVRFLREARAAAALRHENIAQIYAVEDRPTPHLIMEYVPGVSLHDLIETGGKMSARDVQLIGEQIARALAAAHDKGLVHRDLKPANVLIETVHGRPRAKLVDFGLAMTESDIRLTRDGTVVGTPLFMSPEQTRGESLDHRSDLFSLGGVLYAMTAGLSPFEATEIVAVLHKINTVTPPPLRDAVPGTPGWLSDVVARLLAKHADDRFPNAEATAVALAAAESPRKPMDHTVPIRVRPAAVPSPWYRRRAVALPVAGVLVAGLLLSAFLIRGPRSRPTSPDSPDGPTPGGLTLAERLVSPEYEWADLRDLGPGQAPTLTADERVMVFHHHRESALYSSRRASADDPFPAAKRLPHAINAHFRGGSVPALTGDGLQLALVAQPPGEDQPHVFVSYRASLNDTFGEPEPMPDPVRGPGWDILPMFSNDGRRLLTTTVRLGWAHADVMQFTRPNPGARFRDGVRLPLPALEQKEFRSAGWVSDDARVVVTATGKMDWVVHTRASKEDDFGPGHPLVFPAPVGTAAVRPWFTPDGRTAYFHTRVGTPESHIWSARLVKKTPANP